MFFNPSPMGDEQGRPVDSSLHYRGLEAQKPQSQEDYIAPPKTEEQHFPSDEFPKEKYLPPSGEEFKQKYLPSDEAIKDIQQHEVMQAYGQNLLGPSDTQSQALLSSRSRRPLLIIDVDTGNNQKDRIEVFNGDEPAALAAQFCQKHDYD